MLKWASVQNLYVIQVGLPQMVGWHYLSECKKLYYLARYEY